MLHNIIIITFIIYIHLYLFIYIHYTFFSYILTLDECESFFTHIHTSLICNCVREFLIYRRALNQWHHPNEPRTLQIYRERTITVPRVSALQKNAFIIILSWKNNRGSGPLTSHVSSSVIVSFSLFSSHCIIFWFDSFWFDFNRLDPIIYVCTLLN